MNQSPPTLLDHLDAPILVGDPDGCTVYVNPAFEAHFGVDSATIRGQSLSGLFEGGAREAILRAVVDVCGGSGSVHFQLREGNRGYKAIASPISADASSVGVIILLTEEKTHGDRLLNAARALEAPLETLTRCIDDIAEQADGGRIAVADAVESVEDLRKRADELVGMLAG